MIGLTAWTEEQLRAEALRSEDLFRSGRLVATEAWTTHFIAARESFEKLFDILDNLREGKVSDAKLADAYIANLGDALRYLASPPISSDDLKKIANVASLSPKTLSRNRTDVRKVFDVIQSSVDRHRFPWFGTQSDPTKAQLEAALLSSAVLMAAQSMATARRHDAKREQEDAVKRFLAQQGMEEVPPSRIGTIVHGPAAGQFCGESILGKRKADIVVRLHDTRLLAIECKVSNSVLNSVKRINNDAAAKAESWLSGFGKEQVVPAAMLSGVFGVPNLLQAQERGLGLFWAHDLDQLGQFISETKSIPAKRRAR
jgi:hypothetical protein